MKFRLGFVIAAALTMTVAVPALAESGDPIQGYAAAGYVEPIGGLADAVNGGWNISGGMIFHPNPARPFGLRVDLGYSNWNASNSTIAAIGAPLAVDGGYASVFNVSGDALWQFGHPDHIGAYIGLGIGGYRRYAALTNTVSQLGYYCDPWWGCYYASYTGNQVVKSDTLTKFGYNAALGITFPVGNGEMYVETRYHYVDMNQSFEYLPILLGYRF
jgi:Outer membrane protein beta-barrel domain